MKLEVNYQCDICSKSFLLDFKKALNDKKLRCSNCGVEYKFTEEELDEFDKCYQRLLKRLKDSNEQTKIID